MTVDSVQRVGQSRCAHCGGNIIAGQDEPACLQCGRPLMPPRAPTAEERKGKRGRAQSKAKTL